MYFDTLDIVSSELCSGKEMIRTSSFVERAAKDMLAPRDQVLRVDGRWSRSVAGERKM
jgi:hypothetical protein